MSNAVERKPAPADDTAQPPKTSRAPSHRRLREDEWWRSIPAWRDVDAATFSHHGFQLRNTVSDAGRLQEVIGRAAPDAFYDDLRAGLALAPMAVRVTPYILSLIDWSDPVSDPLRRQFLPLASEHEPDHPMGTLDALEEQRDAVAPGLTHRYPDKVLFLALDVCPVYCRYCTRSYSIGSRTETVDKLAFRPHTSRWEEPLAYIREHPQVEDVVVSGGDLFMLAARRLAELGDRLLDIDHVRRIRIATKGLAVMPGKLLSDEAWLDALTHLAERGRRQGVQVCVHTHFAHPNEITRTTEEACRALFDRGIAVRSQCVLLAGVNDDAEVLTRLFRGLAWLNVQPYYVYVHDMVPGVEALRTSLGVAIELEKKVRGRTAGFMTPTFVCDTVGGGGKRDLHSYELYDEARGIAVYRSPVVDPERPFFYFDPLRTLSEPLRRAWRSPQLRDAMVGAAVERAL